MTASGVVGEPASFAVTGFDVLAIAEDHGQCLVCAAARDQRQAGGEEDEEFCFHGGDFERVDPDMRAISLQ